MCLDTVSIYIETMMKVFLELVLRLIRVGDYSNYKGICLELYDWLDLLLCPSAMLHPNPTTSDDMISFTISPGKNGYMPDINSFPSAGHPKSK